MKGTVKNMLNGDIVPVKYKKIIRQRVEDDGFSDDTIFVIEFCKPFAMIYPVTK